MTRFLAAPVAALALLFSPLAGCSGPDALEITSVGTTTEINRDPDAALRAQVDVFLDQYTRGMLPLSYASALAEWDANTRIVEGDTLTAAKVRRANEALAAYTGSERNIQGARTFLESRETLTDLQARQLDAILYAAAQNPQTVPDLVRERIAAEAAQNDALFGYTFMLDGEPITPNDIDRLLRESTDLAEREQVWRASKGVGPTLTEGLAGLQRLRNQTVQALGYDDYFSYQVSDYGMSREELLALTEQLNQELRPLYRELHTWARYELAEQYGVPVPEYLPAHWLPNRWGQDWTALASLASGADASGRTLDDALAEKTPEWIVQQAERFYVSLGLEELPRSFYTRSSLYPLPAGARYKKNTHASAWHLDLDRDVRSLMSVEADSDWYETTHHELGHIYYYLAYTNPDVPPLLRGGANRAYHEAVGSMLGLAAMQPRFVNAIGLEVDPVSDPIQSLLREALNYAVFIPFSAGTMTQWEAALYSENLPEDQWNAKWWELAKEYQGIVPPTPARAAVGAPFNDAATKTHINNDAAQYYDYALSNVLLFQLHDHIATEILGEDPRDTNYYGREDVGAFLTELLSPGATVDGTELLERMTGSGLTAQPMLDYFAPLVDWLQAQNEGRDYTL